MVRRMVDYQTVSIVLTGIGLIIALTYYALQIRNQNRTRQAQLFMQIYNRFNEVELTSKYDEILLKTEWKDYENERSIIGSLAAFFEGIGVLVEQDLVDIRLVSRLISTNVIYFWEKVEPVIKEFRERTENPFAWEYVEWLYNEIKASRPQRQPMYLKE